MACPRALSQPQEANWNRRKRGEERRGWEEEKEGEKRRLEKRKERKGVGGWDGARGWREREKGSVRMR